MKIHEKLEKIYERIDINIGGYTYSTSENTLEIWIYNSMGTRINIKGQIDDVLNVLSSINI